MKTGALRIALGAVAVAGLVTAVRVAFGPLAPVALVAAAEPTEGRSPAPEPRAVDSLAATAVQRNPFRLTRRPAAVAYDPSRPDPQYEPPAPPKPVLVLMGIVAGEQPTAVIEGFPGVEGSRVVRVGDLVGVLRVRAIEPTRVIVVGMDTTWTLSVREPWK